ncbi:MAG: SDR family NAD(P)-dependent oxidoreductase [Verrucomicrobiales bacterium]|nr:SDR family NAD(P)-dependent oxidoreductase [Verrucomicrobiales bacterium]MCP5556922.1 SDR family NAD(P)-dependent oxidoreductase [Verrucomicrobiaceae bacterium]
MRLQDKNILVTGSTTGIGASMARRFVAEGANVILHGRDADRGEKLCAELGQGRAVFVQGDLAQAEFPAQLAEAAVAAFGTLDALVNNAALTTRARIQETDVAFFDRMVAVNLRAPMMLIRALLPALEASKGSVLNVGSILAHCGQANLLAYSVTKGGLMTMTRNLSHSLGPVQVRVNQINVGWTLTENEYQVKLGDGLPADWPDHLPAYAAPFGRLLSPEDIATAAVYWVGNESIPVSGSVVELEQYPLIGRIPDQEG